MKILNKITIKNLKLNKKRTTVTLISIILCSSLLFVIGLFISSARENIYAESVKETGTWHVTYKGITKKQANQINDAKIKKYNLKKINDKENIYQSTYLLELNNMEDFEIKRGRYPKSELEIIISNQKAKEENLKIGDKLKIEEIEYIIVGIYFNNYNSAFYNKEITSGLPNVLVTPIKSNVMDATVTFNSNKHLYKKINDYSKKFGKKEIITPNDCYYEDTIINKTYLESIGIFKIDTTVALLSVFLLVILTVIGTFEIIILFNGFAISVADRKKSFGILTSLGAKTKEIFKSVVFETFSLAIIAIPLGFVLSIIFMKTGIFIVNEILDLNQSKIVFSMYPIFIFIPAVFILIVLFFATYRNAYMASRISPIEAIRMNNDIKIKRKQVKTNKMIQKIFGIEGSLSYKTLKRNKGKYSNTTASISISIILFICVSTFLNYLVIKNNETFKEAYEDSNITISVEKYDKDFIRDIKKIEEIDKLEIYRTTAALSIKQENKKYTKEYLDLYKDNIDSNLELLYIYTPLDISKTELENKYKINLKNPVYANNFKYNIYPEKKIIEGKVFKKTKPINIDIYNRANNQIKMTIKDIKVIDKCINILDTNCNGKLIVNNDIMNKFDDNEIVNINIQSKSYKPLDQKIEKLIEKYKNYDIEYNNPNMEKYNYLKIIFAIKFVIYAFVLFISLISVTSIINTLNNSINNRKREFAILKSIGMSEKKFNKMIILESFILGVKALFYGLSISLLIVYFIIIESKSLSIIEDLKVPFPFTYIIISIIITILIIIITNMFAINKIKKDNIIETIRNDNI
ncbi:MAG: ABC transporter permease [Bacilli bacterium]